MTTRQCVSNTDRRLSIFDEQKKRYIRRATKLGEATRVRTHPSFSRVLNFLSFDRSLTMRWQPRPSHFNTLLALPELRASHLRQR